MPLDKAQLKSNIKTGIKNYLDAFQSKSEEDKAKVSSQDFAGAIADTVSDAVDRYVKAATITVNGVMTTGSATSQTQIAAVTATIS